MPRLALVIGLVAALLAGAPVAAQAHGEVDHRDTPRELRALDLAEEVDAAQDAMRAQASAGDGLPTRWCGAPRTADGVAGAPVALVAGAVAAVRCAGRVPEIPSVSRTSLALVAGAAVVYLASVAIVSAFQPGSDAFESGLDLDVRQQGQVLLSAFWSLGGLAALWVGLRRNWRELRLAGFALLLLAVAKVFLFDLSALGSVYRVASFVALGLLLLTAAFAYQRMRLPGDEGTRR